MHYGTERYRKEHATETDDGLCFPDSGQMRLRVATLAPGQETLGVAGRETAFVFSERRTVLLDVGVDNAALVLRERDRLSEGETRICVMVFLLDEPTTAADPIQQPRSCILSERYRQLAGRSDRRPSIVRLILRPAMSRGDRAFSPHAESRAAEHDVIRLQLAS